MRIFLASSDEEIESCYDVMKSLRLKLEREEFRPRVRNQMAEGYQLAVVEHEGEVVSVGGFRISQNLAWGKFLYVDDLATKEDRRSEGHGGKLLDWLVEHAREHGCQEFHLDSGVQRFAAHRFYLRRRMDITSHHFAMPL